MRSPYATLSRFIRFGNEAGFDSSALELFRYQYYSNEPYRRLCDASDKTPHTVSKALDIPAAPARAFRLFDLTCEPLESCVAVFHTSGTTAATAGKHWLNVEALTLYELSLTSHYRLIFPEVQPIWALMPAPAEAPHSSLTHMLQTLSAVSFAGADLHDFSTRLQDAAAGGDPLTIFGTAFGFAELLQLGRCPLPFGSRIIETGGFKGRTKELSRSEFYGLLRDGFDVPDSCCFAEYGMCEMASQFYSLGEHGLLRGPHWTRSYVIDPATGTPAQVGAPGLIRHIDLANLNSVCCIQTQDRAIMDQTGAFRLLGRATDSELRGCSLTAEELWGS